MWCYNVLSFFYLCEFTTWLLSSYFSSPSFLLMLVLLSWFTFSSFYSRACTAISAIVGVVVVVVGDCAGDGEVNITYCVFVMSVLPCSLWCRSSTLCRLAPFCLCVSSIFFWFDLSLLLILSLLYSSWVLHSMPCEILLSTCSARYCHVCISCPYSFALILFTMSCISVS